MNDESGYQDDFDADENSPEEWQEEEGGLVPLIDRRIELGAFAQPIPKHTDENPVSSQVNHANELLQAEKSAAGTELAATESEAATDVVQTEQPSPPAQVAPPVLAGNFRRVMAKFADWFLTGAVFYGAALVWVRQLPEESRSTPIALIAIFGTIGVWAVWFFYNVIFSGDTLGKKLFRLRVVDERAQPIGWWRALGRTCAETVSWSLCFIGYLFAMFDSENRTAHDYVSGTRVVKR